MVCPHILQGKELKTEASQSVSLANDQFYFDIQLDMVCVKSYVESMKNETYTISDLERETGISRRTIHFYAKERLIPPPEGAGGGARYRDEHLLRLKLISEMQKSHLKLSGIREAIDALSLDEMRQLLLQNAGNQKKIWDKEVLESWLIEGSSHLISTVNPSISPALGATEGDKNFSFLNIGHPSASIEKNATLDRIQGSKRAPSVQFNTWQRFEVMDGVEINVRKEVLRKWQPQIQLWINALKNKIQEGS
jgi:DNA-binding transcriptional MerR regulator